MRKTSAIELSELIIECPTCAATGWVQAAADAPDLVIKCPVCDGHSWVSVVTR